MKKNHTNDKNGNTNDTNEIKELCSELTAENKRYVAAVAKALYFAQNAERASAFQKMGFFTTDSKGNDSKEGEDSESIT